MKEFFIEKDLPVFFTEADSFPEGVAKAHERLQKLLGKDNQRNIYGISFPDQSGTIIYKAAAEQLFAGEAEKFNCKTFTIKKGPYLGIQINDYLIDPSRIQQAFNTLLKSVELDPQGYCLEQYIGSKDLICLVKLKD